MGKSLQIISGHVTFTNTVPFPLVMNSGDVLQTPDTKGAGAFFLNAGARIQVGPGVLRIRGSAINDGQNGYNPHLQNTYPNPLFPWGWSLKLYDNDLPEVHLSATDAAGDISIAWLLRFCNYQAGIDANLITSHELAASVNGKIITVTNTLNLLASGDYTGEQAINNTQSHLKSGRKYALLGYLVTGNNCALIGWRSPDTGNLRIGGPGTLDAFETRDFFVRMSNATRLPTIGVFEMTNQAALRIDGVQDENGADPTVDSIFAELKNVGE